MKIKVLLLSILLTCFFSNNNLHSQNKVPLFSMEFSGDSLNGFDEDAYRVLLVGEGLTGVKYNEYMNGLKRYFVNQKYNIGMPAQFEVPVDPSSLGSPTNKSSKGIGNPAYIANAPCVNEGFELNNISGWVASSGTNSLTNGSCLYPTATGTVAFPSNSLAVVSTPTTDFYGISVPLSPYSGNKVLRIGDNLASIDMVRMSQTFLVTNTNFLYEFAYKAVMARNHPCCEQTYFRVALRNSFGTLLACPLFTFAPPAVPSGTCSSPGIVWTNTVIGGFNASFNPTWQNYSIDLTQYIGSSITIELSVADCVYGVHWGYVYFDSNCNQVGFNITTSAGTSFTAAPTQTTNIYGICGQSATLSAPAGLGPYTWNGPPGSGITNFTTQSIACSIAGNYSVSMQPNGACTPITRVINLQFAPNTTVTATPTAVCGTSATSTLIATSSPAANYTWTPTFGFPSTSATNVITPFATQVVSLTALSGTCLGNYTTQLVVNPQPTVVISNPSGSVCAGSGVGATLTATGGTGNNYTWTPGGLTGSVVVVNPASSTIYTAVASSSGCSGSGTTNVIVTAVAQPSVVNITNPTSSVCAGTPVTLICGGSSSFTFNPSGVTTNFAATLSPSVTTIYTVSGGSGSCSGTVAITVSVDPGPSMTVTGTPSLTCPYTSASLTALAPTSLGFTWTPPGSTYGGTTSTHIVTPTVTTIYTVQGINSAGCRSTYTINQNVAPVPSITITPSTSSICIGSSIVLTASGGSTYTWNPGSVINASVSLSPTTTTNYTVISSNGTCTSSATQSVQVVPLPSTSALASPTVVCAGNPITLTGNGATTYSWAPGSFTNAIVTLTPAASTIYTVTGSSAGCSKTATVAVTVNPNPTIGVVASPTAICPGFSSTLTPNGALTYSLNGLFITGLSPFVVTPPSTNTYTMSGTNTFGCISSTIFTMVVNPTPTVVLTASTPSICNGSSATFSATGAASYTWNPGLLTGASVVVSPTITTVYTATGTSAQGCVGTKTINLTVVPNPTVNATATPSAICVGGTSNLSALGATSYTWSTGALTATTAVSPTITTVYTVTGNSAGCTNIKTVTVVVNPLPNLSITATPTAICPGFNSVLFGNGAALYTLTPGGISLTGGFTVSPASTTIYTLTGVTALGCTSTKTIQLTVNPTPVVTASANPASVCAGNSTTLSAGGASTYTWQPGSLGGTAVVTVPAATTVYTVTGTSSLGCNASATVNVIRVPNPTVTANASPTAICVGASATLTANGGTTYNWSTGATGSPIIVTPTTTTTYTVIGTTSGCTGTAVVTVVVNPLPTLIATATPTSICPGGNAVLNGSGASTYTWNPGSLSGANVTVTPAATTIYTLSATSAAGCSSTKTVQLVVNPLPVVTASANPASVCAGNSTTLSAGGASTYTWQPGSLNGAAVVTIPAATTVYTVTGTSSLGCNSSATVNVTRVPTPTVVASASPSVTCPGNLVFLTGTGATSYTWSTGATGGPVMVSPSVTTTYSVIGLTAGCTGTAAVTVTVNPLPTLTVAATPTAICQGGSSNLSASGATTYTWLPGSLSGANVTVSPVATTIYTVTGSSASGCVSSKTVQLVVNPIPTVIASAIPSSVCAGGNVALTANGASTYTWLPGSLAGANVTVTPATTTIYTVTATSSLACPGQATVLVTVVPNPTITASASPTAICVGASATLTANGGTTYNWNTGATGSPIIVTPSTTTTYTVIGTSSGCTGTAAVTVVVNPLPTLVATATPTSICPGNSAVLNGSGASTYTWNPGALSGANVTVTPAATTIYTLGATSAAGCSSTNTVQLVVNPIPSITISPSAFTICAGGFVTLNATGATNYTWSPGGAFTSTISANPTVTTVYTVNGTNAFGCPGVKTATVTVAPLPVVTATATSTLICPGGSATLTANGATTYTWSTGGLTSAIVVSPSVTTTYSVNGTFGTCTSTLTTITVSVGTAPSLTITGNTTVCAGFSASLTASGATGYTWNPGGSTGANFVVTPAGSTTYTLTGANALGCTSTKTVAVQVNPNPAIVATAVTPTVCAGSGTSLTATGANSYTWNPGNITGNAIFVTPSVTTIYTVTGTSSLGCNSQTNVTVFVQPNPVVTATASPAAICPGGSSTLTAVGASSFVWSTTVMASSIVVSPSVTTIYSVAGVVGTCTSAIVTLTVVVNPLPSLTVAATPTAICPGGVSILSGSGATTYTWLPGGLNTSTISVSPAGTTVYTLTGNNSFNCSSTTTVSLVVNPNPTITVSASPTVICAGQSASLTANGANSYTWLPGSLTGSSAVVNPTLTTTYSITGSSLGCVSNTVLTLNVNPLPNITATASPASICTGNTSTLSASGGTAYVWIPGNLPGNTVTVSPTVNTPYIVTGTSNLGCTNTQTVTVTVNSVPSLSISSTSPTLCSGSSATLTGTGTLSYTWQPGGSNSSTVSVNPASTTVYTLTGSNGFGCTSSMLFTLNVVPTPTINISISNPTVCSGSPSTLTATGANNYTWNPISVTGSVAVVNPTASTVYTLIGDAGGCVTSQTTSIFVNPLPTISASASPTNICNGSTAVLTASGASTYSWMPGTLSGNTVTVSPSVSTDYTVTATDALGCVNSQTVSLIVSPTPTVTASSSSTAVCIGSSGTLTANGATNYTWMPGALSGSQVVVSPSVNTVYTVTGDNGAVCVNSATVALVVNSLPIVTAASNPTALCAGSQLTLTANGANNYTWSPVVATGSTAVDNPTITTTYSVLGEDANGCIIQGTTNVVINPLPTLTTVATPTAICFGSTLPVTLTTSGALTFTWSPIASNSPSITDTPTITSTYSVSGTDALGCIGNSTVTVLVVPIPTINVTPTNATVCVGFSATLTASGAANYTWLPSGGTSSVEVVTPLVTTNYTLVGDNGGGCPTTFTVDVFVNPLPANLSATCSGTITCSSPTVSLSGSTSNTNVSYSWSGPSSYTSSSQNPTGITAWGIYTLAVTDNVTGCVATTTVNVPTDNSIPLVTATTSGSITCAVSTVTLDAVNTTTNPGYNWSGPAGFTGTLQTVTTTVAGVYTVVVTDLSSSCTSTAIVTVGTHTNVTITSTITPATCSLGVTNNDGTILVAGFGALDKFDLVSGSTYTGTATYTSATIIPGSGILTNNLANPTSTVAFTVRFFDAQGCIKDTVLILVPVDCVPKILGVAKAVASTSLNTDGSYNVNYKVVVKNYSSAPLTNVNISENLNNSFPLPATFTLVTLPVSSSTLSGLSINTGFDGFSSTGMVNPATSSIAANGVDTLSFNVKVKTNGVFGPYKNTVTASAVDVNTVTVRDSSANGLNPDPDNDNNPNNNNIPTPINFTPNLFFGLTKVGSFVKIADNTYDVSYTVTIHNLGNDTLSNIAVNDSIFGKVIKAPNTYSITSGPLASGSLIANAAYNGNSVVALLATGSKMLPLTTSNISFTMRVVRSNDDSLVIVNSANGNAVAIVSGSNVTVRDTSNSGVNPDINNNGVWNELVDNVPTRLVLPGVNTPSVTITEPLFIPEGFSPNDDNNNDTWKIKGLPTNMDCNITIYNRWGNRVYISSNYANSLPWDGKPNVSGTLGKDLLPQGTYFYILDIKGSGMKPKTGYVVIQY